MVWRLLDIGIVGDERPDAGSQFAPVPAEEDVSARLAVEHLENARSARARRRRPVEKPPHEDVDASFKEYDITSSPNDFNIRTIVDFIEAGPFQIPGFQRNYVWDRKRASKLIESLLIGLPVPQIFLYEEDRNQFLVIDG